MSEFLTKKDAVHILTLLDITNQNIASINKAMFGEVDPGPDGDAFAAFGHSQFVALQKARTAIASAQKCLEAGIDIIG